MMGMPSFMFWQQRNTNSDEMRPLAGLDSLLQITEFTHMSVDDCFSLMQHICIFLKRETVSKNFSLYNVCTT